MRSVRQRTYKNHENLKPLAESASKRAEWLDEFPDVISYLSLVYASELSSAVKEHLINTDGSKAPVVLLIGSSELRCRNWTSLQQQILLQG